jgi:LmbE family N-acetylglucosaminyl deacetylase
MNVLVVAAHPDDEVLGEGGTLVRHARAGDVITILIACTGPNLRYGPEETDRLLDASRRVATCLGASGRFGGLPDQHLDAVTLTDVIAVVDDVMADSSAELVYVHHPGDLNRDHRILNEAVAVAARPYGRHAVRTIRCFETPSSTEWSGPAGLERFRPNLFVDISATLDEKIDVFAEYASEVRPSPHPRALDALIARARYWGSVAGFDAAEPFVVVRDRW